MKTHFQNCTLVVLLSALAIPAYAQDTAVQKLPSISASSAPVYVTVSDLAHETGLSERNVRMVVGARTPYAEYRTSFNRVQRQFKHALGQKRFDDLMAGRSIQLTRTNSLALAGSDNGHRGYPYTQP